MDIPSFVLQYLRDHDEQGNHNATLEPRHTKGSKCWAVAGAQSADWLDLARQLKQRFGASLTQRNYTYYITAGSGAPQDWRVAAAKLALAVLSIVLMLYLMFFAEGSLQLPSAKELKSVTAAALMTVAGKFSWPHIQQALGRLAASGGKKRA